MCKVLYSKIRNDGLQWNSLNPEMAHDGIIFGILKNFETIFLTWFWIWSLYFLVDSFGFIYFPWCYYLSYNDFPSIGNSDHLVVSVSSDFPSNSKQDGPYHHIAIGYSHAGRMALIINREMFCGRISWKSMVLLLLVSFESGLGRDWCICQMKPYSSSWFSAACASAIVHRNHFVILFTNKIDLDINESSDRLVVFEKAILKLPNLHTCRC